MGHNKSKAERNIDDNNKSYPGNRNINLTKESNF